MIRNQRNNNPMNIVMGAHWQGLMPRYHMSPIQESETRFCVFETPIWGFRAGSIVLRTYGMDGFNTIKKIITRWAPPVENDTAAYINDVLVKTTPDIHIAVDQPIDLENQDNIKSLVQAITSHETAGSEPYNKSFYPFWQETDLIAGVKEAFSENPHKPAA